MLTALCLIVGVALAICSVLWFVKAAYYAKPYQMFFAVVVSFGLTLAVPIFAVYLSHL